MVFTKLNERGRWVFYKTDDIEAKPDETGALVPIGTPVTMVSNSSPVKIVGFNKTTNKYQICYLDSDGKTEISWETMTGQKDGSQNNFDITQFRVNPDLVDVIVENNVASFKPKVIGGKKNNKKSKKNNKKNKKQTKRRN
jgi:hypothetical protein